MLLFLWLITPVISIGCLCFAIAVATYPGTQWEIGNITAELCRDCGSNNLQRQLTFSQLFPVRLFPLVKSDSAPSPQAGAFFCPPLRPRVAEGPGGKKFQLFCPAVEL